jgi:VCBS repeat-containing protein
VLANDIDIDGDTLNAVLVAGPSHGTLLLNPNGSFTYTPNADFNGSDSFTYQANDGEFNSTASTVHIVINPVNDPAILESVNVDLNEANVPLSASGTLAISDVDNPALFVPQNEVHGAHGTFSLDVSGSWIYVADSAFDELQAGQSYVDTFQVESLDGTLSSVAIAIHGTNDAPIANDDSASLSEDGSILVDVLPNDTDAESDGLIVTILSGPTNGSASIEGNQIRYNPNLNFNGSDSLVYQIDDGNGGLASAILNLSILAQNDAPAAFDDPVAGDEDTAITGNVLVNDNDIDSNMLNAVLVAGPAHGTLFLNPNGLVHIHT